MRFKREDHGKSMFKNRPSRCITHKQAYSSWFVSSKPEFSKSSLRFYYHCSTPHRNVDFTAGNIKFAPRGSEFYAKCSSSKALYDGFYRFCRQVLDLLIILIFILKRGDERTIKEKDRSGRRPRMLLDVIQPEV